MNQVKVSKNKKPRNLAVTKSQGYVKSVGNSNYTFLDAQKARYEKGMELYKQGKVSIDPSGYFKVNGFLVDVEKVTCECPDYRKYKQPCKHYFAATAFQKNGCKVVHTVEIESPTLNSFQDRLNVITRLAILNTATEILKTHSEPLELEEVFFLAQQLENWANRSSPSIVST